MKTYQEWLEMMQTQMQGPGQMLQKQLNPNKQAAMKQSATAAQAAMSQGGKKAAIKAVNQTTLNNLQAGKIKPQDLSDLLAQDDPQAQENRIAEQGSTPAVSPFGGGGKAGRAGQKQFTPEKMKPLFKPLSKPKFKFQ